jgi:hypothetical protein
MHGHFLLALSKLSTILLLLDILIDTHQTPYYFIPILQLWLLPFRTAINSYAAYTRMKLGKAGATIWSVGGDFPLMRRTSTIV